MPTNFEFSREVNALDLIGDYSIGSKAKLISRDIQPANACLRGCGNGYIELTSEGPPIPLHGRACGPMVAGWLIKKHELEERYDLKDLNLRFWLAIHSKFQFPKRSPGRNVAIDPNVIDVQAKLSPQRLAMNTSKLERARSRAASMGSAVLTIGGALVLVCFGMALQQRLQVTDWNQIRLAWSGAQSVPDPLTATTPPAKEPALTVAAIPGLNPPSSEAKLIAEVILNLVRGNSAQGPSLPPPMSSPLSSGASFPVPELLRTPNGSPSLLSTQPKALLPTPAQQEALGNEERDSFVLTSKAAPAAAAQPKAGPAKEITTDWDAELASSRSASRPTTAKQPLANESSAAKMAEKPESPQWSAAAINDGGLVVRVTNGNKANFSQVRPGGRLPNGELLRSVQPDTGVYVTDAGSFNVNPTKGSQP